MDFYEIVVTRPIGEIAALYPIARDFFFNYNLHALPQELTLEEALADADESILLEFGLDRSGVAEQLVRFLEAMEPGGGQEEVRSITILGGKNKRGEPEDVSLTVAAGEVVSIVGPTGSGKSRLLADIECLAQRDTPTGRRVLINDRALSDEERFGMGGRLVAQLSQNMNFVMDLSVREFLEMHARSRLCADAEGVIAECLACANALAGERFAGDVKVTQLSGGQSRALMIADTATMSASPVVLIDEIENAGIDRRQAIGMLAKNEKIVLISTHDPLLALNAHRRVVIKNGGIRRVIETSEEERESLAGIERLDSAIQGVRQSLRKGERITPDMVDITKEDVGHVGTV